MVPGMQAERSKAECLDRLWAVIAEAEAHLALTQAHAQAGTSDKSRLDTTMAPCSIVSSAAR